MKASAPPSPSCWLSTDVATVASDAATGLGAPNFPAGD